MTTLCYILTYTIEVLISYIYLESKFVSKFHKKYQIILTYALSFALQFAVNFLEIPYFNLVAFVACVFFIALLFYNAGFVQAVSNSILLTAVMLVSELTIYYLSRFIFGTDVDLYLKNEYILIIQTISIKLLYFLIVYLIIKISSKDRESAFKFTKGTFLFILPVSSILVLFGIVRITEIYTTDSYFYAIFIAAAILLLYSNIIVFGVYESILKTQIENTELQLLNQKSEIDTNYYAMLQNQYENSNILIHDIKHHLLSIKELSTQKDCIGINNYIDNLYGEYQIKYLQNYSSNKLINAIINRYAMICNDLDIKLFTDIRDIDFSFISDNNLTSILDNILENAVEASKGSSEKRIELTIRQTNLNFVAIKIWNYSGKAPNIKNGKLVTTKDNHNIHGFGIKSIERIARQYSGNVNYSFEDDNMKFSLTIILKIK
ncbi:MAG: GHKL domain-containing protein [Oscillospiraceae bacterium]|nr:GHKL domain-containing protein [Oscillospiraceae bacterium]